MAQIRSVSPSGLTCPFPCARVGCRCTLLLDGYYCCAECKVIDAVDPALDYCTRGEPVSQADLPKHHPSGYVKKRDPLDGQNPPTNPPRPPPPSDDAAPGAGGGALAHPAPQQHHQRALARTRVGRDNIVNNNYNNPRGAAGGTLHYAAAAQHQQAEFYQNRYYSQRHLEDQIQIQHQNLVQQQIQQQQSPPSAANRDAPVCPLFCNPQCNPPLGGTCTFYHPPALPQLMEQFLSVPRDQILSALVQCNDDARRAAAVLARVVGEQQQKQRDQQIQQQPQQQIQQRTPPSSGQRREQTPRGWVTPPLPHWRPHVDAGDAMSDADGSSERDAESEYESQRLGELSSFGLGSSHPSPSLRPVAPPAGGGAAAAASPSSRATSFVGRSSTPNPASGSLLPLPMLRQSSDETSENVAEESGRSQMLADDQMHDVEVIDDGFQDDGIVMQLWVVNAQSENQIIEFLIIVTHHW